MLALESPARRLSEGFLFKNFCYQPWLVGLRSDIFISVPHTPKTSRRVLPYPISAAEIK